MKTKNEQEGDCKTTQAGHSVNPFMVTGCLFTVFYQVIIPRDNSSDKLPLGTFSVINKKYGTFRREALLWRHETCECYLGSSFLLRAVCMLSSPPVPDWTQTL